MQTGRFIFSWKLFIFPLAICIFCISCHTSSNKYKSGNEYIPNPVKGAMQQVEILTTGEPAPDFNLPDISGKFYALKDFKKADILIVLFTCNHCPTAQAYEERIIAFVNDYKDKGVQLVAISPTSIYGLLPEECAYSDLDDTYESMKIRAKDKGYNFPYLYDGDDQAVSLQYGPEATPHVFVFNRERKLVYNGRIDASEKPGTANAEDLRAAVEAVLNDKKVENPVTKTFGCSIKWSWKTEWTDKVNKEWISREVSLNKIDRMGIQELMNNNSDKLRLINVWATWCAPCVIEFPELVKLQRIYGSRAFEFVSISADNPEAFDKVHDFLRSKNSAIKNFIFDESNKYALIETVDSAWNGALPYTMMIEPGGNIIYSRQGAVDLHDLKKIIVEHPMLGRYY